MRTCCRRRAPKGAATVRWRFDRFLLRESAACSRDSVRLFGPRRGQQELDLLQLSTGSMAQVCTRAPQVVGRDAPEAEFASVCFTTCQTRRSVTPSPQLLPARQTQRNSLPVSSSEAATQSSTVVLTQHGTGTVAATRLRATELITIPNRLPSLRGSSFGRQVARRVVPADHALRHGAQERIASSLRNRREPIVNYFPAQKLLSSGVAEV
jgi:hypothetical protein